MERNKHQGIPRTLLDTSRDFLVWGSIWFLSTVLFSLPAVVAVLVIDPKSVGYLLIGVTVLSISFLDNLFEEDTDEEDDGTTLDPSNLTQSQLSLYLAVLYAVLSASVSTVLLFSSLGAGLVGYTFGYPLVAIVFAAIFPIVDAEMAESAPFLSLGSRGMDAVVFLITGITRLYGIHAKGINETTEKGRSIY